MSGVWCCEQSSFLSQPVRVRIVLVLLSDLVRALVVGSHDGGV